MHIFDHSSDELKQKSQNFDFANPPYDPIEFSQQLVRTMHDNNGICLAAIQVGVPHRIFAMRGAPQNFVCYNPRVVQYGSDMITLEEVSLSYGDLKVKIKRPQHCRVRFATPNGEMRTETFTGLTARVFQHCMDFLDGTPFYSRAGDFHRHQAIRKIKKLSKKPLTKFLYPL